MYFTTLLMFCDVQYSCVKQLFINISSHFHCQYLQMTCLLFTRYVLHVYLETLASHCWEKTKN